MMDHGVSPRTHGNHGKIPHNTFSFDTYQFATRFLEAYIEKHGKEDKTRKKHLIRMPKNVSLKTIHEAYHAYGVELNEPSKSDVTFNYS